MWCGAESVSFNHSLRLDDCVYVVSIVVDRQQLVQNKADVFVEISTFSGMALEDENICELKTIKLVFPDGGALKMNNTTTWNLINLLSRKLD